ncbi:MAG: phage scaffolding protein [Clostridiales bacterium]
MTLQEILKAQGLSEEQIQTITGEMGKNKVFIAREENLDIRYKELQSKFDGKDKENKEATALIEQLKKDNATNEAMQTKITEYQANMTSLQTELEQTKVDTALKVALLEAKAVDVDYLTYKIKSGNDKIILDDNGKIKGLEATLEDVKKQYPTQFKTESPGKKVDENTLPDGDHGDNNTNPKTLAEALQQNYESKQE